MFFLLVACGSHDEANQSASAVNQCSTLVCLETVNVGDVGNPADSDTGYGAVNYDYAIGKYEITVNQYLVFLNAVADIPANAAIELLWNADMEKMKSYVSGGLIKRTGAGTKADPYVYTEIQDAFLGADSGRRGVLNISWFSAARFANWLHNGATKEAATETGAYTLNGAVSGVFIKNPDARWWIPSEDEWYKAAYYDPTRPGNNKYWKYPTRSDVLPTAELFPGGANAANYDSRLSNGKKITPTGAYVASSSYYGTYDQAGLLWEWNDAVFKNFDGASITRGMRGGSWSLGMINISKFGPRDYEPTYDDDDTGFRLATKRQ